MNYAFMRFPNFRDKAITLSYDDGAKTDEKFIDIISKGGLKATFNVNSGILLDNDDFHLSLNEAINLYRTSGNEIAVHGYKHLPLAELPVTAMIDEVFKDRQILEKQADCLVRGMAYAYGSYDDRTEEVLKLCGIVYSRTVNSSRKFSIPDNWLMLSPTCHHNDPELFNLAESFFADDNRIILKQEPKIFYLWGHSHEFERNRNWDIIEEFVSAVGGRDDVWYVTNIELYDYVKAYDNLIWSSEMSFVFNPSLIDVFLLFCSKNIVLRSGETTSLR